MKLSLAAAMLVLATPVVNSFAFQRHSFHTGALSGPKSSAIFAEIDEAGVGDTTKSKTKKDQRRAMMAKESYFK